ncbi:MAG TPA: DUF763 domain-containing protein, partial [Bryobacteraceae bacterium]|nr:DUF763 domain-containing protein [Bryobacteraceae bacterium]
HDVRAEDVDLKRLGAAITESILLDYGHNEFLTRLSDPFWFQAFGSVMGMDWHSSGITTSVMSALKRGLNPRASELGIYICGGRGNAGRATPCELAQIADARGLDGNALQRTSRLTAKIDNNCIADGFQIYLHSFVLTAAGEWAVIQQGMKPASCAARRYHWHSANVRDFVEAPHSGIAGENQGLLMNLVDAQAKPARGALLEIARNGPDAALDTIRHLRMPDHHDVRAEDVDLKRLGAVLATAYDRDLKGFADLLLVENLGPRTLQTLALVAEVVHGTPTRFDDPARFSFALGGKDGHPFPVPLKTYDESLGVLRRGLDRAKLAGDQKTDGLRRLDRFVRQVENQIQPEADFDAAIAHEHRISKSLGGRTVFDDKPRRKRLPAAQLRLF